MQQKVICHLKTKITLNQQICSYKGNVVIYFWIIFIPWRSSYNFSEAWFRSYMVLKHCVLILLHNFIRRRISSVLLVILLTGATVSPLPASFGKDSSALGASNNPCGEAPVPKHKKKKIYISSLMRTYLRAIQHTNSPYEPGVWKDPST